MLFDNEGTLTNKHAKYGDMSRIPNIKISSHENKRAYPKLAHMSTRVKRNSGRQKSARVPVSLNSANLPDSSPLTSNSESSEKMLPRRRRSLRRSGNLTGDDESKSAEKIKPRRPLNIIPRPASENKRKSLFDSSVNNSMGSPRPDSRRGWPPSRRVPVSRSLGRG